MPRRTKKYVSIALLVVLLTTFSTEAFAIDKRLKLLLKTAGYGAAAGLVLGAASTAMGMGGLRNVFMGASAGLYAGIALAGFIILTPNEKPQRSRTNPYAPRKPVGPDDPDQDDDQIREMVPDREQPQSSFRYELGPVAVALPPPAVRLVQAEKAAWMPVFGVAF